MILIAFASGFILLSLLALVGLGYVRLGSSIGILRDGIAPGKPAPSFRGYDTKGLPHDVGGKQWQLLLFTNHSLRDFPDLPPGIANLIRQEPDLDVLLLQSGGEEVTALTLSAIDELHLSIPVVPVDQRIYRLYNVRVLPFLFFIDPRGVVRGVGLANDEEAVFDMWRSARIHLATEENLSRSEVSEMRRQ